MYLNIYDLSDQNSWTYWCGVGIFHSGLEVYGVEYAYGGEHLCKRNCKEGLDQARCNTFLDIGTFCRS